MVRDASRSPAAVIGLTTADGTTPQWAAAGGRVESVGWVARCTSGVAGDVNGDGFADVAVGEPGNSRRRSAVHLFYGHTSRLVSDAEGTALNDQYLTEDTGGIPGTDATGDRFGTVRTLTADSRGVEAKVGIREGFGDRTRRSE